MNTYRIVKNKDVYALQIKTSYEKPIKVPFVKVRRFCGIVVDASLEYKKETELDFIWQFVRESGEQYRYSFGPVLTFTSKKKALDYLQREYGAQFRIEEPNWVVV